MNSADIRSYSYKDISRAESKTLSNAWSHCVHIMLYADLPPNVWLFDREQNVIKSTVMMQMRFDGRLGFPGGFVDADDDSLESALMRELSEEMGTLPENFSISPDNYLNTQILEEKKYCLHFYTKEVTFEEFKLIEKRPEKEPFEGFEVLGVVRVPLYLFGPTRGGFPAFLKNNFIGNARNQLIHAIRLKELLSEEKLQTFIEMSQKSDELSSTSTV